MKIEIAKRESIKFQEKIIYDIVASIFGEEMRGALVTDESRLNHFRMHNPNNGENIGDGKYKFISWSFDVKKIKEDTGKMFFELKKEELEHYKQEKEFIIDKKDLIFDTDIINIIKKEFGVVIDSELIKGRLVDIASYISKELKGEIRDKYYK